MIRLLTLSFVLLIVLAGCTEREETPKPDIEHSMAEKAIDPVCGMEIEKKEANVVTHDGKTYHVCSDECKEELLRNPDKYTMVTDPVCGMSVSPSSEHMHTHHDKTYYFCSPGCKEQFEEEPEKFLKTK